MPMPLITERARPGLVVAPRSGGRNSPATGRMPTRSPAPKLTDMGGGPVFYDCLVEVAIA